ncbi:TPA: hypothetical protein ACH3X2_000527 [Trebouxia sp. C0005]
MALRSFYGVSVCSVSCLLSIEQSCAWMWARYYPVAGTTPLARFKPPSMTRMATVVASITGSPVVGRVAFIMGSRNVELHLLWRHYRHRRCNSMLRQAHDERHPANNWAPCDRCNNCGQAGYRWQECLSLPQQYMPAPQAWGGPGRGRGSGRGMAGATWHCDARKALYASAYASADRAPDGGMSELIITRYDSSNYLVLK